MLAPLVMALTAVSQVGGTMLDSVASALAESTEATVGRPTTVSVSFFYKAACHHCLSFFQGGLLPLLWAELPGDRVRLDLLPWVPSVPDEATCLGDTACYYARDHMCVLARTLQTSYGINSTEMKSAVRFAYCDLYNVIGGATPQQNFEHLPECAQEAGLAWAGPGGVQACIEGVEGFGALNSAAYKLVVQTAQEQLQAMGVEQMAPFIMLDGKLLVCHGPQWCTALRSPTGEEPLETPGTLLRTVCSRLYPVPQACTQVMLHDNEARPVAPPAALVHGNAGACENCAEVGSFRFNHRGEAFVNVAGPLSVSVAAIFVVATGVVLAARAVQHHLNHLRDGLLPGLSVEDGCTAFQHGAESFTSEPGNME